MRIVIAGAAGFIGYHLSRRLLEEGHEVVGIDSLATGQPENAEDLQKWPRFTWMEADIVDPLRLNGPVDRVFDLACPASPVDFGPKAVYILRTCSEGVRNLLELANAKGAMFVHASTSECYGDALVHPQPETYWGNVNPIGPRSPYDEGKRFAEAMTMAHRRQHGTDVRLFRIFNTYGPRMRMGDGRVIPNFINQAIDGQPLTVYGDGSQTRSLCYVSDLVEGILRLTKVDYHEPVNLGSPDEVTILDLAREIVALIGSKSRIVQEPLPQDDPKVRRPDISLAKRLLGWEPTVPRREGLRATIEEFQARLAPAG
jgi:nucleoside-diphosphate-sugar epimerase